MQVHRDTIVELRECHVLVLELWSARRFALQALLDISALKLGFESNSTGESSKGGISLSSSRLSLRSIGSVLVFVDADISLM